MNMNVFLSVLEKKLTDNCSSIIMTSFFSFNKMHSIKYFSKNGGLFVMQAIRASKIFSTFNKRVTLLSGGESSLGSGFF